MAQINLPIIVIYKGIVTLIKSSILMIYLRIGTHKSPAAFLLTNIRYSCQQNLQATMQRQHISTRNISVHPHHRRACAMYPTVQGMGLDGSDSRSLHQRRCLLLWYAIPSLSVSSLTSLVTSAFHIFADLWILILPYKLIFSIPRSLRQRLAVYAVFGLGGVGTIAAMIRFHYLVVINRSKDPFYDSLQINIVSIVEVNVGILCASLPTLRPLFSQAQRDRTRHALNMSPRSERTGKYRKRAAFLHTKEMFITITAGTWRGEKTTTDEDEFDLLKEEYPPPVPPKDEKFSPTSQIVYPDMAYRKP
jgi:hypothetical protein